MSESARIGMKCLLGLSILFHAAEIRVSPAQQPASRQSQETRPIRVFSEEVVVDVIVTDRNGKPITNLGKSDFEISEDRVKQQINSFRLESRGAETSSDPSRAAAGAGAATGRAAGGANLVSLVFDTTSIARDGAQMARAAAEDFVKNLMGEGDFAAVFGTGISMHIFQPFTQVRTALLKAIEQVTSGDMQRFGSISEEIRRQLETIMGGYSDAEKMAAAYDYLGVNISSPDQDPNRGGDQRDTESTQVRADINSLAYASLRTLLSFQRYEREYQGRMNVSGLLAIIEAQRVFPGRKSLLYFSGGFSVAPTVAEQFRSVISAANRANVTVYSIDAAGLRLADPNLAANLEMDSIVSRRMRNANPELVSQGQSALGRVEEMGRLNTLNTLEELSAETGGSVIKNTNDFKPGMRRIVQDLQEYYVLTYTSSNPNYDGRFRNITVKVNRQDLIVRSRSGYYAFRSRDNVPLMGFEAELLQSLNAPSAPADFPLTMAGYHFRGRSPERNATLFVEFPMSSMKMEIDKKKKSYQAQVDTMMLLKDSSGVVLRKLSREYSLNGGVDQLAAAQRRNISFFRTVSIPSGQYSLEGIVRDRLTGKAAVRRGELKIEGGDAGKLQISSIILSKNAIPATEAEKADPDNPFVVQASASVMPDLWHTFRKSADRHLLIYFNVYPAAGSLAAVRTTLEFLQDGKPILRAGGQLPAPDATGRIQYVTTFGLENFQPGDYTLRVTVRDGQGEATTESPFRVES